jgi:hypothetical protein
VTGDCRGIVGPTPGGASQVDAYLASPDRVWPFRLENLCEPLSLDPISLRQELQKDRPE